MLFICYVLLIFLTGSQKVIGSIPIFSTKNRLSDHDDQVGINKGSFKRLPFIFYRGYFCDIKRIMIFLLIVKHS